MATAITPVDLSASNYAGENITTATFDTIASGTGVDFDFSAATHMILRNDDTVSTRTFTVTIPIPPDSVLADTNSEPADKTYAVLKEEQIIVKLADAMRDSNGKVTVDCDGANCKIRAYK